MVACGAFDYTGVNRATLLASVKFFSETARKEKKKLEKQVTAGQLSMFEEEMPHSTPHYIEVEPFTKKEQLRLEKKASGMFLSEHPLDAPAFPEYPYTDIDEIRRAFLGEEEETDEPDYSFEENSYDESTLFYVRGIVTQIKEVITKKNEKMAFMTIEDVTSQIEVPLFPSVYAAYKERITEDDVVTILGTAHVSEKGDLSLKPNALCREDEIRQGIFISLPENVSMDTFVDEARLYFKSMHKNNKRIHRYIFREGNENTLTNLVFTTQCIRL